MKEQETIIESIHCPHILPCGWCEIQSKMCSCFESKISKGVSPPVLPTTKPEDKSDQIVLSSVSISSESNSSEDLHRCDTCLSCGSPDKDDEMTIKNVGRCMLTDQLVEMTSLHRCKMWASSVTAIASKPLTWLE